MPQLSPSSPLYNYPLPAIEDWLRSMGCEQDVQELNCWYLKKDHWQAEVILDTEDVNIIYLKAGADGSDVKRAFRYSLSRQDIEDAIFSGP